MKAIGYYRVSTARQGATGYGLDAQRTFVEDFCARQGYELINSYTEVESGRKDKRPKVAAAIAECKRTGATLVVAKMDRLARSVSFLSALRDAGIDFKACDYPDVGKMTLSILMAVAENEADMIRDRTRAGIRAAMAKGVKWGQSGKNHSLEHLTRIRAESAKLRSSAATARRDALYPTVLRAKQKHGTLQKTADALNAANIEGPGRAGTIWYPATVQRVLRSPQREGLYDV